MEEKEQEQKQEQTVETAKNELTDEEAKGIVGGGDESYPTPNYGSNHGPAI